MPPHAVLVIAWMLISIAALTAPAGIVSETTPSWLASVPPPGPTDISTGSPRGVPGAADFGGTSKPPSEPASTHVKDVVAKLRAAKKAPRTVRNVYWTLKAMYRAAQVDDVASPSYTPCILTKNELGRLADAKSNWRTTAKFERDEFESLISDTRVPWDRRVYALLGLGMLRHGEAAGLRWSNYQQPNDADIKPLGRLVISTSYDTERTKTRVERWMPVHPVLAAVLAEWRLAGWPREFGRVAGDEDLIVPHTKPANRGPRVQFGGMRSDHDTYKRLRIDCDAMGLRHRRVHDLRRTGITLAREDGADKDVLRFCTHGGPEDIMDVYTSLGWAKLCAHVSLIDIARGERGASATGS